MKSQINLTKIVVLGEGKDLIDIGRVGKTSISLKYVYSKFSDGEKQTVNAVYCEKNQPISNGSIIKFGIWDTAGQQKYNAIAPIYYREAQGAVIVYDITSSESFQKVKKWIQELKQYAPKDIIIMVCGNKSDLENQRKVNHKEAELYAKTYGASHFLVSAKSGAGIEEAFASFAQTISKFKSKDQMSISGKRNQKMKIEKQKTKNDRNGQNKKPCC